MFGGAPLRSLSPAYWKRRVILPPERSWNLLQLKPDGCVHGAVRHSCSPPYDVRKSGSRLSEKGPPTPPVPAKTGAPLLGGSTPAAKPSPRRRTAFFFLYLASQTLVSFVFWINLEERTRCLFGDELEEIWRRPSGALFLVQIYSLWNSAGLNTWGRVTGRRPTSTELSRRDRDKAAQTLHTYSYKFKYHVQIRRLLYIFLYIWSQLKLESLCLDDAQSFTCLWNKNNPPRTTCSLRARLWAEAQTSPRGFKLYQGFYLVRNISPLNVSDDFNKIQFFPSTRFCNNPSRRFCIILFTKKLRWKPIKNYNKIKFACGLKRF